MTTQKIYDLIGVGIGPFNLSLAALIEPLDEVDALFFDQTDTFEWHPGMLIEGMDLQTPFIADLVTFADPTSPYTFLNYLHHHDRMYQFYFFNRFDIPRKEYNKYCQWVANQLKDCHFGHKVIDVKDANTTKPCYEVTVQHTATEQTETYFCKHLVLGTGSVPNLPPGFEDYKNEDVIHTSQYVHSAQSIKQGKAITVMGSGQSAAEVFYDLLLEQKYYEYELTWFTRSGGFFQKEDAKLGKEVFSPEYVHYFHELPFQERLDALETLDPLRNGVDPKTLQAIYHLLYNRSIDRDLAVTIQPTTEANGIKARDGGYELSCKQWQEGHKFTYPTDKLILATGYKPKLPQWLEHYQDEIFWEDEKRFKVSKDYRLVFKNERPNHLFTLTNIEHSHGASATNLGLSVLRNQTIINTVVGKDIYPEPSKAVFQQFSQQFPR
ncbi:lysine N(6)-hydroxylase/L-ornithine N(5)-oxygenase family protein [Alkalihalobacillus pseudalcaliphilus]|uniref:lysine N(6)-hydroxylase/L-ornithine N(5)-oxygenase family protein n=1 Tax=Alkalihalobacillus pseudalcaliphilus TaxID=79884 RepID=UPI00064D83D0|nr:SidA/IucD/PvdA family monooxygenase [Alkalihalobacillus pseudalcaliphilus]KMK75330.1 ornithine monooxygenase [Alkalihalobacillus pseudalcaliphilus]